MSNNSALVAVACGASALALALSVAGFLSEPEAPAPTEPAVDLARIERLEASVAELDRRIGKVHSAARDRVGSSSSAAAPADIDERIASIEAKVAAAEETAKQAALDAHTAKTSGPDDAAIARLLSRGRGPVPEGGKEDWQRIAVDRNAEAEMRVGALRALRRVPDGRTREVALAMRDLFHEIDDSRLRTDIVRQLSRVVEPELETWFVETLQTDAHQKTREEAAENLAHFEGSQNVIDALRYAAENDKDREVRSESREALDRLMEDVR